ncbi:MAG: hypothetical protein RJB01_1668, partial [Actinomycetota bacterium]
VGAAVAGDWGLRTVEMRGLVDRIWASEQVMMDLQDQAAEVFDANGGPAALATNPKMREQLTGIARAQRQQLELAANDLADQPILPWHRNIADARAAYLAHNFAWQDYLERASEDAREFVADQPEVNDTFMNAEEPLYRAVPIPDITGLGEEIELIYFVPDETASGGEVVSASFRASALGHQILGPMS